MKHPRTTYRSKGVVAVTSKNTLLVELRNMPSRRTAEVCVRSVHLSDDRRWGRWCRSACQTTSPLLLLLLFRWRRELQPVPLKTQITQHSKLELFVTQQRQVYCGVFSHSTTSIVLLSLHLVVFYWYSVQQQHTDTVAWQLQATGWQI